MKRLFHLLAIVCFAFACSPSDEPTPVVFANSPTCAYPKVDFVDGKWLTRYYFFDLNHKDTKDKKFFVAEFMYKNYDTMRIVSPPQSIDILGSNFPSEIMDYPGYGLVNQWTNASYVLNVDGSGSFYKNPIPTNPASNLYFLNQTQYVGSMAGKWPNAFMGPIRIPDGTGSHFKYNNTFFYFKHNLCYNNRLFCPAGDESNPVADQASLKSIDEIIHGVPYEWETVATGFSSTHSSGNSFPQHYFLDFKKWRYFVWTEYCDNDTGSCFNRTIEFGDYKDLDKMLKWPEGWGKL
ncbi:MAG: hypothetical protein J0L67_20400 [Cytophagales bacterium]|nr:hypothetical protein [Cytophagales bacterium]